MRKSIVLVVATGVLAMSAPGAWAETTLTEKDVKKICGSQYGGGGEGNYGCSKCSTSAGACADYNCKDGKCTVTPVTKESVLPGTIGPQKSKIGIVGQPPTGVKGTTEESAKSASKATLKDITIVKPVDKSSPTLMADDVRNLCSKNPNCRVVRDDSQLTAFCVGDNCVAARKKGKDQQEYLQVKMSDLLVSSYRTIKGKPIATSQGIIAILIGMAAPTSSRPADKQGHDLQKNVKARLEGIKGESKDDKHGAGARTPPPTNLLESGPTTAPPTSGPARAGVIKRDTVAPTLGGPGGPMMGQ